MRGGLDRDQRAAAAAATPLLIIAGPGTGKTRTLTHRIAYLTSERGVAPGHFLAITFTRRAGQELRDRLAALIPGAAPLITITTFHGLGLRILREHHDRAGLPERFGVADEAAQLSVATDLTGSGQAGRALLAQLAGKARAEGTDPLRESFRKALLSRGLVDFDGLVELAGGLLRDEPDVARGYRERWPHISVDEYQDIDAAQYALLKRLARTGGDGLAVIGDPDQAIYGFRGADVGFFLRFRDDFPSAQTAVLTTNYRSGPAIVAGALQAIAPGHARPGSQASRGDRGSARGGTDHPARGRRPAGRSRLDRRDHRWLARRLVLPLAGFWAGRWPRPRRPRLGRHSVAVPDRRAGGPAHAGADPCRAAIPETLT